MTDRGPVTLDELIVLQRARGLEHVHLAAIGGTGFHLAHTDDERARGENTEACRVHRWLAERDEAPAEPGVYAVLAHEPDAYSESYRSDPWDLYPLDEAL